MNPKDAFGSMIQVGSAPPSEPVKEMFLNDLTFKNIIYFTDIPPLVLFPIVRLMWWARAMHQFAPEGLPIEENPGYQVALIYMQAATSKKRLSRGEVQQIMASIDRQIVENRNQVPGGTIR